MSQDSTVLESCASSFAGEESVEGDCDQISCDARSIASQENGNTVVNNFSDRVYFHNVHHHEHHNHRETRTVKRARVHLHVHHHHHYHVGDFKQQEQERAAEATAEDQVTNAKVLGENPPEMIADHGEVRN